jgi:hypothetical protein
LFGVLGKHKKNIQSQILEAFSGDLLEVPNPPKVDIPKEIV